MWRRCFSQAGVQWTRTLAAVLVGSAVPAAFAYAVEPDFKPGVRPSAGAVLFPSTEASAFADALINSNISAPEDGRTPRTVPPQLENSLSPWNRAFTLKAGVGYKDNLTLAPEDRESSPFVSTALELFALREAVDGHQLTFLASAEDARYWAGKVVDHEDLALAQGEWRRFWPNGWQAALGVEGIYLDQVIDVLTVDPGVVAVRTNQAAALRVWSLNARPGLRREWSGRTWLTLELPVTRVFYNALLDDHWELGPKVTAGRAYGHKSEASVSYAFTHRDYDTERGRNAAGAAAVSTRTAAQHDALVTWRHYWDAGRRWRSTTKLGFRHSAENISGYFDYQRYHTAHELRFQTGSWELSGEARFALYRFPVQTVSDTDARKRRWTNLTLSLRGERQLAKQLRLYAQYEHETTDSNSALDEYAVNTVSGGVAVEF